MKGGQQQQQQERKRRVGKESSNAKQRWQVQVVEGAGACAGCRVLASVVSTSVRMWGSIRGRLAHAAAAAVVSPSLTCDRFVAIAR